MSERTVRRAIIRLCEIDLLKLQQRTGRHNVYSVNVGLIHRLITTGHSVRSLKGDRTPCPLRPDTMSGQSGQDVRPDRTQSPANNQSPKEEPTEEPISSPFGSSITPKGNSDPLQRRLALAGLVQKTAQQLSVPSREEPNEEKQREVARNLAAGALAVKERPG